MTDAAGTGTPKAATGTPSAAGQGLVDRGLEAAHVLHGRALSIARLQVLVQHGDDLVIKNLELADSLHHLLQRLPQGK